MDAKSSSNFRTHAVRFDLTTRLSQRGTSTTMYSSAPLQTLQWQATIRHGPEAPYLEKRICCPDRSTGLHGTGYLVLSEIVPVIKRRPLYDIDEYLNFSGLELCLQVARGWNDPANFGSVWNRCDRPTWYSSVRGYTTLRHFRLSSNM